ncbi:sulfate ABC transporter substrate-binding protein [Pseudooceanicola sp. CBS1P-1]|uniref:Sulfate ABC transporter substrate-binding protein n=1 Tax=Pseudooceanicola albus TaxID=2692189 RepID=A0A6L7GB27_9RHOB|nr:MULTISPECIES: sulfate ABC transporter substrate-binding protein [Pseudooceanicola]MBT9385761.1 sulfate ABC transporter substrate-binding protein [Pseudooceanicola endophyticus]MXN19993.1 sulfate ABC transporter substrate-binding protein [Pseudooceanicola albus]
MTRTLLTRSAGPILAALLTGSALAQPAFADTKILNVSYDPTREFYRAYNTLFAKWWQDQGHGPVTIEQSHGGSGAQARAVIDGLDAQVATLALASDLDAIAARSDALPKDWEGKLPHNSAPYTSTIVFLVRKGNPKGIHDWGDLVKDGVQVITPNPKTSGGARWNFLAAWGWALKTHGGDEAAARDYVSQLYQHVPVLDTGARGATTTFTQRGTGDVLLAWENEALLALDELGHDKFEIVVPSVSIRAEPPVALLEGNIKDADQRAAAEAYLQHLYSPEAQALAVHNHYRAWDTSLVPPAELAQFPDLQLMSIADFGGWAKVQPAFFGSGGIFDQIYGE